MKILRQKIYVSPALKRRVALETTKRNIKFLGKLGKLAGKRTIETGNLLAAGGVNSAGRVAKDIVAANKETLINIKNAATTIGGGNNATVSKRIGTLGTLAIGLSPSASIGRSTAEYIHNTAGKSGKDVVTGMAEFATNPAKSMAGRIGNFRKTGHGGKAFAGAWVGPGRQLSLGFAPDSIVSSVGAQFEEYKGADNLRREVEALVNSKDGRRFARSYDRRVGKFLNPVHDRVEGVTSKVPGIVDNVFDTIKSGLSRKPQPQPVPVRAFSERLLELPWTKENISRFKSPGNMLRHAKTEKGIDGVILCKGDELVGYIAWKKDYIQALEVPDKFKRSGHGERLVKKLLNPELENLVSEKEIQ